jgi:hypothetical protein
MTATQAEDILIARHYALAQGYAWGRQDATVLALDVGDVRGRVSARDTDAATRFATAFTAHYAAYRAERIGMMHNMESAYDMFVRDVPLPGTLHIASGEATQRPWQADCEYCQRYSRACGRHDAPKLSDSFGHRINPV